jgi:hypothetical protein
MTPRDFRDRTPQRVVLVENLSMDFTRGMEVDRVFTSNRGDFLLANPVNGYTQEFGFAFLNKTKDIQTGVLRVQSTDSDVVKASFVSFSNLLKFVGVELEPADCYKVSEMLKLYSSRGHNISIQEVDDVIQDSRRIFDVSTKG